MGSLDSAESLDLVGLFILYNLTVHNEISLNNIGIYRDDGLMVGNNSTGSKVDKLRKWIHRVFKSLHLKVKINSNIKQVDFLDVTLNLHLNNFQPFLKNNANPIYINPNYNHPTPVIKHIPSSVERRINKHSSSKEIFDKHKIIYNKILTDSGYRSSEIKYRENCSYSKKKQ